MTSRDSQIWNFHGDWKIILLQEQPSVNLISLRASKCEEIKCVDLNIFFITFRIFELRSNQNFYSGSEYYYGSSYYCTNPFVKYQCSKNDSKKMVKLQINSSRGAANCYRDFSTLNREFFAVNHQNNFMTQCNLAKYLEKSVLILKIRVSFKLIINFYLNLNILRSQLRKFLIIFALEMSSWRQKEKF